MRIGVIFSCVVMAVLFNGLMWRKFLQPYAVVMMKPRLIIVDENRRGDMHGIHKHKPFFYPAVAQTIVHLRRNVDECDSRRCIEPEFLTIGFHPSLLQSLIRTDSCAAVFRFDLFCKNL